jgi:Asp-tRNA(Asn)/Glu-tRNA(Gln) amidotransferase A subunit family amidase
MATAKRRRVREEDGNVAHGEPVVRELGAFCRVNHVEAAGLGGLPQLTLPLGTLDGCPLGLSIVGARGTDSALLALAASLE